MCHLFQVRVCRRIGGQFETLETDGCQGEVVAGLGLRPHLVISYCAPSMIRAQTTAPSLRNEMEGPNICGLLQAGHVGAQAVRHIAASLTYRRRFSHMMTDALVELTRDRAGALQ